MWSPITPVTVCVLGRGWGGHERRRGIFTRFTAEYPNEFLWIRYLFTAKKVKSDSAHSLPSQAVSLGVIWGRVLQSSPRSLGSRRRYSAHFMWAAASCQCRSCSTQISQCSSKVLQHYDKVFQVYESLCNTYILVKNIAKAINQQVRSTKEQNEIFPEIFPHNKGGFK